MRRRKFIFRRASTYFIKIRKEELNENNIIEKIFENKENDNDIKNNNINNRNNINNSVNYHKEKMAKKKYSYECININSLRAFIYEGIDNAKTNIIMKNNGKDPWPINNTKLIYDTESIMTGDEIILQPQKPEEEEIYDIVLTNLKEFPIGEYESFLWFYVGGEKFGDRLTIRINIKPKNVHILEIEKNIEKINNFRKYYSLSNEKYSDEQLLEALTRSNFDKTKAFQTLSEL